MSTAIPINKPTRRTVEALFRELSYYDYRSDGKESSVVYQQMEELEERLKATAKYKRLRVKYDKLREKECAAERHKTERVRAVRTRYLAEGLTDKVQQLINGLVKEFSK